MNIYETLRTSIISKKPCKASKPGEPERKVCPYLIGKSSEGEVNVLYYQFEGYSKRGLKEDGSSANWLQPCFRYSQCRNRRRGVAPANPKAENTR